MSNRYLHDLSALAIQAILLKKAWQCPEQPKSSAQANTADNPGLNCLAAQPDYTEGISAYMNITFESKVKWILDVGGGKYDHARNYMLKKGYELLIWDPFRRSKMHNRVIKSLISNKQADAATSMSVLNVIENIEARLAHICTLKAGIKTGGKAYFKVWAGKENRGGTRQAEYQHDSFQANAFADAYLREIEVVFGNGNVSVDRERDLIIAEKKSDNITLLEEINLLKKLSQKEWLLFESQTNAETLCHLVSPAIK
jgi:hypothetical protein